MTSEVAVSLRPALTEDRFRIRRWLADPEIEQWWGNAASAEAEINLAMSSQAALCRVVEREGAGIGYAQALEVGEPHLAHAVELRLCPRSNYRSVLDIALDTRQS